MKNNDYEVEYKILDPRIGTEFSFPKYATKGSSGLDVYACLDRDIEISSNNSVLVSSGIAIFLSNPNITAIIIPRSGLGHKHGIILGNTIGLIDSDYQGEIMVSVWNRKKTPVTLSPGMRIAQIVFLPIMKPSFKIVESFEQKTERNDKGFGHSGFLK